ncbi:MAG: cysteine desulfurase family protein [Pseudomonadota bacterium]
MYFDYNATSPMSENVWSYLSQYSLLPLNPSAPHDHGSKARKLLEKARHDIINFLQLNMHDYDVIFTSSATESNNMILQSMKHLDIYVSAIEHSSVYKVLNKKIIKVDLNGLIDFDHLKQICDLPAKKMISIGYANGEIGVIQNMEDIKKICQNANVFLHTDCTQAIGKVHINFQGYDFITFSGHKFGGPVGIGVCVFRKNSLTPLLHGGNQEFGMRAGTENVLGALGLTYVLCNRNIDSYIEYTMKLRSKLEDFLLSKACIVILGYGVNRLSNTVYFISKEHSNEELLMVLDMNNCSVSTGSACLAGINNISHVVQALKYDRGGIRISFGLNNTLAEVDKLCEILNSVL